MTARTFLAAMALMAAPALPHAAPIAYDFTAANATVGGEVIGRFTYDPDLLTVKDDLVHKVFYEGGPGAMSLSYYVQGGAYDGGALAFFDGIGLAVEDNNGSVDDFSMIHGVSFLFLGDYTWQALDSTDVPEVLTLSDFGSPIFYIDTDAMGFGDGQVRFTVTSLTRTDDTSPVGPSEVPLPAGLPLIAGGLAALGLARLRRRA